ncbi:MAG: reverse transcriptase domain-containing protein [Gammaproteobacteria bacterium]
MKRIGGLWQGIVQFENLHAAYRKARLGKNQRPEVASFTLNLERNLLALQAELVEHRYVPGGYRVFQIYDRKARTISAAPFRDRVVHHALLQVVEPFLDRKFIEDSYACRKGKGVHAAVGRYQAWATRYAYVLKADIRRYFPSIDHRILKQKLRCCIKDHEVLWLFDRVIDSAPRGNYAPFLFPGDDLLTLAESRTGLPIGNLTSQFLANLYLNDLDHYIKQVCGVKAYLRYVDDLFLLADHRDQLWEWKHSLDAFLLKERLYLHPNKAHVMPVSSGVDVLGYRVFPFRRRLRKDAGYRFRRNLRQKARGFGRGKVTLKDVRSSTAAWLGYARFADSAALARAVLGGVLFRRGTVPGNTGSRGSRRRLEQQTAEPAFRQPQQEHRR